METLIEDLSNEIVAHTVLVNKREYQVIPDEFVVVPHPEYTNLKILAGLGEMERIIGLMKEIASSLEIKRVCVSHTTHGGFVPIELAMIVEPDTSVFIANIQQTHLTNILTNTEKYGEQTPRLYAAKPQNPCNMLFLSPSLTFFSEIEQQENIIISASPTQEGVHLMGTNLWIHIPFKYKDDWEKHFYYWMQPSSNGEGVELAYDNLIDLCIMVKNAGPQFESMLQQNMHLIDKWTILDTGSTDETMEIINRTLVGKKRGCLYQEPFINFRDSRNRLLELAGKICKYTIMLDDTYVISGDLRTFLEITRGDQFSTSFSMYIKSDDVQYTSNRILKTERELKYIYKLHEVIDPKGNINVIVPFIHGNILDGRFEYMEERTMDRKSYDLRVLEEEREENPDDPRSLYYFAQTYNLLKKYELAYDYFLQRVNHPTQGFVQERHDAYFEAGRIANFQLNYSWDVCKNLYEKAYEVDSSRPESQYFIGIHYYLSGDHTTAYSYFKKAFEIGYPIHCEFSLKPTLSFFFLPKFLVELCYTIGKDYVLGKAVAEFFFKNNHPTLENEREYTMMRQWINIFTLLIESKPISQNPEISTLPILVFVADGGFSPWTGRDVLSKGMGGSETFIVELARSIQKTGAYQVVVFCKCEEGEEDDVFEGVYYYSLQKYLEYISKTVVKHCIISRYTEYVPCTIDSHVENIYVILHDIVLGGMIIPIHPKLKKVFCLTDWHVEHFLEKFPQFQDKTQAFSYGLRTTDQTIVNPQKIPYKFIYSSFPNRGLLPLLQMWRKIVAKEPTASLYIYSDVNGNWVNDVAGPEMLEIRKLLREYELSSTPMNIKYCSWVDKKTLLNSWATADVWFYPTTFVETFCLTALESAYSKTLAITMNVGALKNTVGDRGLLLEGDPLNPQWQDWAINIIFDLLDERNRNKKNMVIERNFKWALNLSWENRAKEMIQILGE